MNKSLIVFAGLAIGTAAFAQETITTTTTMPAGPEASTTVTTTQAPTAATDVTAAAPAADATASTRVTLGSELPAPSTADMSSYPRCSASVTDHCVQREGRRLR